MSIAQQRISAAEEKPRAWPNPVRFPAAVFSRTAFAIGRALVGSGPGTGIRGYGRREGYPEHELHQIVAGRKDRFDGLM